MPLPTTTRSWCGGSTYCPRNSDTASGRAILAETLARFPAARTVSLEGERGNAPAIRFYERNGFAQARLGACCGDRSDIQAIIMEKSLTRAEA